MAEQFLLNISMMRNIPLIWCCCLFGLIQMINSTYIQIQFMSFCNQTMNMSSPLSIIFTPPSSSFSSCCNMTFIQPTLNNFSEQILINLRNLSERIPSLQIFNQHHQSIEFLNYSYLNRIFIQTNVLDLPLTFSLCQFNIQPFEIFISNISKGPCQLNQYRCLNNRQDQWCIDEIFRCDGYHSCPQGIDEINCPKSMSRITLPKMKRAIHGGIVTSIIILGLLLIIASVSIAVAFVYVQRKRQRRRQFTYSLESTSDDWEPTGMGYHLFDNSINNRRNPSNHLDNSIIDSNENVPITNR